MTDLSGSFELSIDCENHLSFEDLDYWEEGGLEVSVMAVCSKNGVIEERFRVVKYPDNTYSVGNIMDFGVEEDGIDTYDVRNAHVFIQRTGIQGEIPVEENHQMMGPFSYIEAIRFPKLLQAKMNGDEELFQQIIYDIALSAGVDLETSSVPEGAALPREKAKNKDKNNDTVVVYADFGSPRPT